MSIPGLGRDPDRDGDALGVGSFDRAAGAAAADPWRLGWTNPRAPNGRVLPCDLRALDEDALLRPGRKAALYAVGSAPGDYHPEREPLVLVHGIRGDPANLQSVLDRFRGDARFQVYVLCYDDYHRRTSLNGYDFAEELRALQQRHLGAGRDMTIVAHSMGGIVSRQALNALAVGAGGGLERFGEVRLIAVDTPWHGYGGPSDRGADGFFMSFARPFMPDGLEDMRAASAMFAGDPSTPEPVARAGLYGVRLPDNVSIDLVFAQSGGDILDYTEGALAPLAEELVGLYCRNDPVRGGTELMNFWKAINQSSQYLAFAEEMRALADQNRLDANAVRAGLQRHFPRFPGDHTGVLAEQPGRAGFLDWLCARLR